ncbi:MAG TPA: hypothetical protein VF737_16275, partial [Gemmatimonadaceae bacterium]
MAMRGETIRTLFRDARTAIVGYLVVVVATAGWAALTHRITAEAAIIDAVIVSGGVALSWNQLRQVWASAARRRLSQRSPKDIEAQI